MSIKYGYYKKVPYLCDKSKCMDNKISKLFFTYGGYLTRKQMPDSAIYKQITRLANKGVVERVRRGVYYYSDEGGNMIDIDKVVPGGVLCLYSALFHYELTVYIPHSFCIAIEQKRKLKLPDYPPISLYYWDRKFLEIGVERQNIEGFEISITNLERTVCDAIKFRSKVGDEIVGEVIREYVKRKDRNLSRLMEYAKAMRIEKTLRTYMTVGL